MRKLCYVLFLSMLPLFTFGCISAVQVHNETVITPDYQSWSTGLDAQKGLIRLYGNVDSFSAQDFANKMLILNEATVPQRISIYINSNGGEAGGCRAILNIMRESTKPVDVIVIGNCYSAACAILQSATGRRMAYPNAHFMVHGPGVGSSKARRFKEALYFESKVYEEILRKRSSLPEKWFPLGREFRFFTSKDALRYNFIDEIIDSSTR